MITDSTVTNRNDNLQQSRRLAASDAQLYRDVAQASGGQAVEVTKAELPVATEIIKQSATSSLVISLLLSSLSSKISLGYSKI